MLNKRGFQLHFHFLFTLVVLCLLILGGAVVYQNVEGWSRLDSIYFVVVTITTIGYGDLAPVTSVGKIFTMFYAFFGIAMAFYLISIISSRVFRKHLESQIRSAKYKISKKKEKEFKQKQKRIKAGVKAAITRKKSQKKK